jgi:hypothetical protein
MDLATVTPRNDIRGLDNELGTIRTHSNDEKRIFSRTMDGSASFVVMEFEILRFSSDGFVVGTFFLSGVR